MFNKGIYHNQYTENNRKWNNHFTEVEIERVEYSSDRSFLVPNMERKEP